MPLIELLLLAVLQGLTEFLPVSSSGHLNIAAALFATGGAPRNFDQLEVNVFLHVGTLISVLVFYWQKIWRLLFQDRRVIPLLVVGTLPAVAVGLPLKKYAGETLESPLVAGLMLPVTGLILLALPLLPVRKGRYRKLTFLQTLMIGCAQAFAILPGISRSGATITVGVAAGLKPRDAATFSFLLAIPAILGGGVLEAVDLVKNGGGETPVGFLFLAALVAALVGYFALAIVVRALERAQLHRFAWWCIPVGLAVTAWQAAGLWSV